MEENEIYRKHINSLKYKDVAIKFVLLCLYITLLFRYKSINLKTFAEERGTVEIEVVNEFTNKEASEIDVIISRYWWHYSSGSDPYWIMGTIKLYDSEATGRAWTRETINKEFNTLLINGKETIEFEVPANIKEAIINGKAVRVEIGVNKDFYINTNKKFKGALTGELTKIVVEGSSSAKMSNDNSKVIFSFIPYYQIDENYDFNKALIYYYNNPTQFDYKYPYIRDGFGEMVYSMYSRPTPTSLGTSYGTSERLANLPAKSGSYSDYLVGLQDISKSCNDGLLTTAKEFLLFYHNTEWQYKFGSQMKIGNGTMNNGGAVGFLPYFPFSAHFYIVEPEIIEDPIDPIEPKDPEVTPNSGNSDFVSNAIGVIKADNRGSEKFDVTKGIPTGENLYVNVLAKEYLYSEEYNKVTGTKIYPILVERTYDLYWTTREKRDLPRKYCLNKQKCVEGGGVCKGHADFEYYNKPHTDKKTVTTTINIQRDYEYYTISNFELYKIKNSEIMNEVLTGKKVTLLPSSSYKIPEVTFLHDENESAHLVEPILPTKVTLPNINLNSSYVSTVDWSGATEAAEVKVSQIKCKSDKLIVNNTIILSDKLNEVAAEKPSKIPSSQLISNNSLYKNTLYISDSLWNGTYSSTGNITYERVVGSVNPTQSATITKAININSVIIHTPVYCEINLITDENTKNRQLSDSLNTIRAGTIQQINVISTGQHKNITGYGDRDYAKYVGNNEIKSSFDFYIGTDVSGIYVAKNTWYSVGKSKEIRIYIPDWSRLGEHTIELRSKANNSNNNNTEQYANLNINNSIATSKVSTYLEPKLYDFTVSFIDDIFWSSHFTKGVYKSIDLTRVFKSNNLPIMPMKNSNPKYEIFSVKKGYNFYFDLKTNGEYLGEKSFLEIQPTFYYLDKNGKGRTEVDLYYFTNSKLIKAKDNTTSWYTSILNSWVRAMPIKEINNTILAYQNTLGTSADLIIESIKNQSKIGIGAPYSITLGNELRTFVGNISILPNTITKTNGITSVSKWSGQYFLPNNAVVVPKGMILKSNNLTESSSIFLRNGYIVVNFNMYFNKGGIRYRYYPQWEGEGYPKAQGFELEYGDIILYETDHNASEDYNIGK